MTQPMKSLPAHDDQRLDAFPRRGFLAAMAGGAAFAAAGGGLAGLSGCSRDTVEEFLQSRFEEMSPDEIQEVVARLKREYRERYNKDFNISTKGAISGTLFGYGLDISRCVGCRRCVHACVRENNASRDPQVQWIRVLEMKNDQGVNLEHANPYYAIPPEKGAKTAPSRHGEGASTDPKDYRLSTEEKAILADPMSQYPLYKNFQKTGDSKGGGEKHGEGAPGEERVPRGEHFYMPVACQQCRRPPCVKVCPVKATWQEPDGIVVVDYNWCIGCRYCMAACPYGARHFNWGDPSIPEDEINTDTHYLGNRPRYRGHVEKCTFCIQRVREGRYPACVEICPVGARKFGDLNDADSEINNMLRTKRVFVLKRDLNTVPKFFYFYS